jgi:hypothetical protein
MSIKPKNVFGFWEDGVSVMVWNWQSLNLIVHLNLSTFQNEQKLNLKKFYMIYRDTKIY